jgi:hypothetical protein
MFRNKLTYYHGTSLKNWNIIQTEKKIKPSHTKKVGDYWITKGAYFVCENPYIALWYAHVAALRDKSQPIVLAIEYEADKHRTGEILNLLTADGHKALSIAHNLYKEKLKITNSRQMRDTNENLDSVSLQLLMERSEKLKGVMASFQEGRSFQSMIIEHKYINKYIPEQKGFSPGDHVEICFYPELDLNGAEIKTISKKEILSDIDSECNIWELVCQGLTEPMTDEDFKQRLFKSLNTN